MKRLLIYPSLSLLSLIVIAAVVWKLFFSAPDLTGLVPSDATAIAMVDVKTIITDAGVPKSMLKDIDNDTGVDFSQPVYIFRRGANVGFVAAVDEVDELDDNLDRCTQRSGYTFGVLGGFMVCHDDERLLCMGPLASLSDKALLDEMVRLMRLPNTPSYLMERLERSKSPVAAVVAPHALPESLYALVDKAMPHGLSTDSLMFVFDGSVSENSIKLSLLPQYSTDESVDIMAKLLGEFKPITATLVSVSPQDPAVWLCMGVHGDKLLKQLRLVPKIRSAMLGLNMCIDADMMMNAAEGDMVVAFPKVSLKRQPWVLLSEVKDTRFMRNRSSWNTSGLGFGIDIMGTNTLVMASVDAEMPRQDVVNPNTSLTMLKSKMMGQHIFLSINVPKVLNPLLPALAVLGYGEEWYRPLDVVDRVNVSIGVKESSIELTLNRSIREMVESWNQ